MNYTPPKTIVIGTCSICNGPVLSAKVIIIGEDSRPWCQNCGARPKEPIHGPIIEMQKEGF